MDQTIQERPYFDLFRISKRSDLFLKLSKVIIGRSNAEWSSSNIRIGDDPEVYHTNENVSWQINPSPMYWGEVAKNDSITTETEE